MGGVRLHPKLGFKNNMKDTSMTFQIHALPPFRFSDIHNASQAELEAQGVKRIQVDAKPGYLCRISLKDAEIGESVFLLNFTHQPHPTPYQSSHAIFINTHLEPSQIGVNEIPIDLSVRHLSVRAFNKEHHLVDAKICEGIELKNCIHTLFANEYAVYLHIHHSAYGCYIAKVTRG
ncbi:MAG: hypothetical protein COA43_06190 [Robiginitomaculum sp.]|nr:MAG: hypothetical protein COA43_06190 [Robiginitomaculum sp.]